jgi:hypothetical protein
LQARCLCFLRILSVLLRLACLVPLPGVSSAIFHCLSRYSFPINKRGVYVTWSV